MGLRACAIKKYVVEYGDTRGFNWGADTLANIIGEYCDSFYSGGGDYNDTNATWEVDAIEFKEMIKKISELSKRCFNGKMKDEWLVDCLDDDCATKEYVLKRLQAFYDEADKSDGIVRIVWL